MRGVLPINKETLLSALSLKVFLLALSHTVASAASLRCIFIGCYFFPKIYFVKLICNLEYNQVLLGDKFSNTNSLNLATHL